MTITARDIISLTAARAQLSELAEQVKAGAEKIITKNGESYVALIDAQRLDHYHRLERAHIQLLLIDDAANGLQKPSQVMVDKAITVKRDKVGPAFGRIDVDALVELERCLAVFLGIAK